MDQDKSFFERDPHITDTFNEAAAATSSQVTADTGTTATSTTSGTSKSGSTTVDDQLAPKFTGGSPGKGLSDDERMEAYARQAIENQKNEAGLRNNQVNQHQMKNTLTP